MFIATSKTVWVRIVIWFAASLISATCGCSDRGPLPSDPLPRPSSQPNAGQSSNNPKHGDVSSHTVELVIDYGDGVQRRFADIDWKESMTVLDVLKAAQKHSHGISFSARGSGETAMVTKLDDLVNQKDATDAKNWIFRINGRLGDESCGLATVRPGDTVLWKFEHYE